ncbi:MAG: NAD(P)-dependent oxidoreductase [Akkermansia sp.]|nr:NAD(P)-dependent oxidoreductase [Akkermansia sp.]
MKMLLFGGSGRTGQVMCRAATAAGWDVVAPSHADCALEDSAAVAAAVLACGADAVVNCAAISGLEACAADPLAAHAVNAVAPATMALACRHTGARFVHLSTDYVLDGRKPALRTESCKCKPVSVYGESKREGELQVAEAWAEALVLRVSWVCGNPARPSFVESTLAKALRGEPLAAIGDKYSMPTDAADIARVVLQLLPTGACGVFHVCSGGEPQSWYSCAELALQYAHRAGALPAMPPLRKTLLKDAAFFAEPRPQHTAMCNAKLLAAGIPMPTAQETILHVTQRYLAR